MPINTKAERQSREHRRPLFLHFLSHEQFHCVYKHIASIGDKFTLRSYPTLKGQALGNDMFLPTRDWWKLFCEVDIPKFAHMQRLQWFLAHPADYQMIVMLCTEGSGAQRAVPTAYDQLHAMQSAYVSYVRGRVGRDIAEGKIPTPDDDEFLKALAAVTVGDDDGDDDEMKIAREKQVWQVGQLNSASNTAEKAFSTYYHDLFAHITREPHSIADYEKLCEVNADHVTCMVDGVGTGVAFLQRLIAARWMRDLWEGVFEEHLELRWPRGFGIACTAANLDLANKDAAMTLWDMTPMEEIQTRKAAHDPFISSPYMKRADKVEINEMADRVQPVMDVLINSTTLEFATSLIDDWDSAQASIETNHPNIEEDNALRFVGTRIKDVSKRKTMVFTRLTEALV